MSYLQAYKNGEIHNERGFYFFVVQGEDKIGPFNSTDELCRSTRVKRAVSGETKKVASNDES